MAAISYLWHSAFIPDYKRTMINFKYIREIKHIAPGRVMIPTLVFNFAALTLPSFPDKKFNNSRDKPLLSIPSNGIYPTKTIFETILQFSAYSNYLGIRYEIFFLNLYAVFLHIDIVFIHWQHLLDSVHTTFLYFLQKHQRWVCKKII